MAQTLFDIPPVDGQNRRMEHLLNLFAGMGRVLELAPERDYIRPRGGFAADAAALRGDVRRVGNDLKQALQRHGQQINHRQG